MRVTVVKWLGTLLAAALMSAGCGAVDVQVAPIFSVTPTVAPTLTPSPQPPIIMSSAGLVARSEPDDGEVVVKTIAYPHLVFAPGVVSLTMFPQWAAPQEYMVVDSGRGLRLRASWRALWLADSAGSGRVSVDVYLRWPGESDFAFMQTASTEDFESAGEDFREELLDSTVYLPESGDYRLRVVTRVTMSESSGQEASQETIYETDVIAVYSPSEPLTAPEDYAPAFGGLDLEWSGWLIDWRGWRKGPCFLSTDAYPEATAQLDTACVQFENGDWGAAAEALQAALGTVGEDMALQNRLRQQLGTLAAAAGQWNVAVRHFTEGLKAARELDDSQEVGIALHNLGVALRAAGMNDEGDQRLFQSAQVFDQIGDYLGAALTWGQFSTFWRSADTAGWVYSVFSDHGLPQAEVLGEWRDEFGSE
jgi:tetratricopeptide (TPR) repeat protein